MPLSAIEKFDVEQLKFVSSKNRRQIDISFDVAKKQDVQIQIIRIADAMTVKVDKTIVDETPDRPDVINEFEEEYEEYSEDTVAESTEDEYSEYNESGEEETGITVDEHGTEWYEDEVGVWWFREPGQDDWAEFTE